MDLSAVGGSMQDTVKSDGILVLDRQGKKVWGWSVFDALDPLKDPKILAEKKDWMPAFSVSFDRDGNYLMSFLQQWPDLENRLQNGQGDLEISAGTVIAKNACRW